MLWALDAVVPEAKNRKRLRSSHGIIAGILKVCEQETKRTHVLYKANLSYSMAAEYFTLLVKSGLLHELPKLSGTRDFVEIRCTGERDVHRKP